MSDSTQEKPVVATPGPWDADDEGQLEDTMGLCVSGGGYRAMLFHLGTLWRLNDSGFLSKLARISSVSGGSITCGMLALRWAALAFGPDGRSLKFRELVAGPIMRMASRSIDVRSILTGLLWFGTIAEKVAQAYRDHLFGKATLQELPDQPRFVFNATSIQTGTLWRFSKKYMGDYQVGLFMAPRVDLAVAVGASSAFPPVLSPVTLDLSGMKVEPDTKAALQRAPFTTRAILSDGGVYDNMGIETVWKRCKTVLVSDAGAKIPPEESPHEDWARHAVRVLDVVDNQVRSLRKRQLIDAYKDGTRTGAYWGIRSDVKDYGLADAFDCPHERTLSLAAVPTRLAALETSTQERLVNWGYAVCDAALRKHVIPGTEERGELPFPSSRI